MFQRMLKIALGKYGFEVITASHGVDALMQYKTHEGQFGAVILGPRYAAHEWPGIRPLGARNGLQGPDRHHVGPLTVEELREYEPHAISGFFHKPFEVALLAAMLLQAD